MVEATLPHLKNNVECRITELKDDLIGPNNSPEINAAFAEQLRAYANQLAPEKPIVGPHSAKFAESGSLKNWQVGG